jgi:hypothetical protein
MNACEISDWLVVFVMVALTGSQISLVVAARFRREAKQYMKLGKESWDTADAAWRRLRNQVGGGLTLNNPRTLNTKEDKDLAATDTPNPRATPESQGGVSETHLTPEEIDAIPDAAWDASVEQIHRELAGEVVPPESAPEPELVDIYMALDWRPAFWRQVEFAWVPEDEVFLTRWISARTCGLKGEGCDVSSAVSDLMEATALYLRVMGAPEPTQEPVARTLYALRCGWCGAYEGTVDPAEPCARDNDTGDYIGPHQFGIYEQYSPPVAQEREPAHLHDPHDHAFLPPSGVYCAICGMDAEAHVLGASEPTGGET